MKAKRLWYTLRMSMIRGGRKRADYAARHKIFAGVGRNVLLQSRTVPLYSELIRIHDNVVIARNVDFCTHDVIHGVLNRMEGSDAQLHEHIGCIEIMDNVFVGSNSVILYGTRIGPNVIIASGSVVTKDCEPDSVYAGCPARRIGSFSEFTEKRINDEKNGTIATTAHNQALTAKEISAAWEIFDNAHRS